MARPTGSHLIYKEESRKCQQRSSSQFFDEYVIAYKDRSAISDEKYVEKLLSMGSALTSVLVLDGKVAGTWRRVFKKGGIEMTINPLRPLSQSEREEVEAEAVRYGKFLEMPLASHYY